MDNEEYWREYERQTGERRPPWIDGVGNVNYHYWTGQRPERKAAPSPAQQVARANLAQYVPMRRDLIVEQPITAWRPYRRPDYNY